MTDLQPHRHPRPATQLSAGARFIRGFTRIGAVVAVLVALIGVSISVIGAVSNYNSAEASYRSAKCIAGLARSGYAFPKKEYSNSLDYSSGGCTGYYHHSYNTISEVTAIPDAPAPTFFMGGGPSVLGWGILITGLVAVVAYLAFWAIGCAPPSRAKLAPLE